MNNFKKICDKQNLLLEYNKESNIYSLMFTINNKKNINIKHLLDDNIFKLLKTLNPEIIEEIIEIKTYENENIILFIFKEIGKEAGLKQKFMFLNNIKKFENNKLVINTKSVKISELMNNNLLSKEILKKIDNLKEVNCEFATLTMNPSDNSNLNIYYIFKILLNENVPKYLENIIGLLMKKIFLNFKIFIEN